MSNIRAEQFSNSDELKGMVKAFLYDKVDSKRCLNIPSVYFHINGNYYTTIQFCYEQTDKLSKMAEHINGNYYATIQFCYEQTDKLSKMAEIEIAIKKSDTCYEIKEKVNEAIREIEEAEYNDLTHKDY